MRGLWTLSLGACLWGVAAAIPAFPGAEGFGAQATGGRGGKVVHVNNLAAAEPGSLQAALDLKAPRTIVFDVSGVVQGVPVLSHGDVTVAGQTSPSGIILRGFMIQGDVVEEGDDSPLPKVYPRNFIVRHLRLRSPLGDGSDGDGLRLHHAQNGIIDLALNRAGIVPQDSDRDGIPDAWEKSRGLNPSRDDSQGHKLDPGYTDLEVYLNELGQKLR